MEDFLERRNPLPLGAPWASEPGPSPIRGVTDQALMMRLSLATLVFAFAR